MTMPQSGEPRPTIVRVPKHYVYFHHNRRRALKFWLVVIVIGFLTAVAAIGFKLVLDGIGKEGFKRYEPVDVPPAEISERHGRERLEYERREEVVEKGPVKPPTSR
jgi:hypothetical protein